MNIATTSLLLGILFATPSASPIVGKWESIAISKDGIGVTLEFFADGTFSWTTGAVADLTYTATKDKLTTAFVDPQTGKRQEQSTSIEVTPNTFVQKGGAGEGKDLEMKRVEPGKPGSPLIVGVWSYPHSSGMTAYITFTSDGRMLFRLPRRSAPGGWTISGQLLTLSIRGQSSQTYTYAISGDVLTMIQGHGEPVKYKRVMPFD
jgi:hypothetical protein